MKRFDSTKLFKLACQDVVERFHLLISLLFVLVSFHTWFAPAYGGALPYHVLHVGHFAASILSMFTRWSLCC